MQTRSRSTRTAEASTSISRPPSSWSTATALCALSRRARLSQRAIPVFPEGDLHARAARIATWPHAILTEKERCGDEETTVVSSIVAGADRQLIRTVPVDHGSHRFRCDARVGQ